VTRARAQTRRSGSAAPPIVYAPQLARLVSEPPAGDEWLHELKYDGYRIGCRIANGSVRLISRNGKDWTAQFPEVRDAALRVRATSALLDGEVAMVLPDGRTSFQALQNVFSGGARDRLVYFVFDLLHLDGDDIAREPLERRKTKLSALLGSAADGVIRYSEHVVGRGGAFFAKACRLGLEGIVSKRRDLPYEPGRRGGWLKTKCVHRQEFVVGGFTDPEGSRAGIGAVLIGVHAPRKGLVFAGKVGTGFTQASAQALRQKLERLATSECPFTPCPAGWLGRNAHWVKPKLVAEVAFTEWTDEGKIRHPSFQGLRADKSPAAVVREEPRNEAPPERSRSPMRSPQANDADSSRPEPTTRRRGAAAPKGAPEVAGVRLSHPERVLYPDDGITKLELARYYESIGDWIVPHLAGRPLTLVRCPEGIGGSCFYMKHSRVWSPEGLRRVRIPEKTKLGEYLVADSLRAVIALVQMDVLEIHTWNSTIDRVEHPDRMVLDLDPGPEVRWAAVVDAARLVRRVLSALGLQSFVKTTGGVGLHVVVPLAPELEWRECFALARELAETIQRHDPRTYTTALPKAGRERKILIDYLRNNRTNTSVAAFSTRARPRAPVSVPLAWDELDARMRSDRFTVRTVANRLRRLRADPWKAYWRLRQRVPPNARAALATLR
jgi:bifunctional non-homologous end joining protein LigD